MYEGDQRLALADVFEPRLKVAAAQEAGVLRRQRDEVAGGGWEAWGSGTIAV